MFVISLQAKIHSIDAGSTNEVPRDVFQRVLDGAYLALNIQHGTIDAFYFVKDDIYSASNDIKTLRRMGPSVNLTSHDSQTSEGLVMMDVKVHLENTVVRIFTSESIAKLNQFCVKGTGKAKTGLLELDD